MKKVMFVLMTLSLIALALVPAACSKESAPTTYLTYSLTGVTFSYPMGWIDGTADMEYEMALEDPYYDEYMGVAAWYTPSDSAGLFAITVDMEEAGLPRGYDLTEGDKEFLASSMTGYMTAALDQPTIVSQGQTTVSGQWAWQMEFSGKIEGVSAKGYELTVISNDTVFLLLFATQSNVWDSLKSVYDTVKYSIVYW